jgi:hypothetical protein
VANWVTIAVQTHAHQQTRADTQAGLDLELPCTETRELGFGTKRPTMPQACHATLPLKFNHDYSERIELVCDLGIRWSRQDGKCPPK